MTNVHVLHPPAPGPAAFLRVGYNSHQSLEALLAANRLRTQRFVFEAAHLGRQRDLLSSVRASGSEVVIDPNFAEAATSGRFGGSVGKLPWANPERPWAPEDFGRGRNADLIQQMAEFAVGVRANAVLTPSHGLETAADPWLPIDREACLRLRRELDDAGGAHIGIDFQLITHARLLIDPEQMALLIEGVADLPIQNFWLRASGFGADATSARTRNMIEVARRLHDLGRPVVLDMAGGFAGLSLLAFGAVGGLCHGVSQRESFDLRDWSKPPSGGGGSGSRVYVAELDRHLKPEQARAFLGTRGAKARFGCRDTTCCARGLDDMIDAGPGHFLTQRHRQIEELAQVPEDRRAEHFLLRQLDPAVRSLRQAAKLKFPEESIIKIVGDARGRLERLRDALAAVHEEGEASVSRAPSFRGGSKAARRLGVVEGGRS
jgi:hypothetical protein